MRRRESALALCAFSLFVNSAHAVRVAGVLDRWHTWSIDSDTTSMGCIAGEKPCSEPQIPPPNVAGPGWPVSIPVAGEATFSDATITALVLEQTTQVTLPMSAGRYGELTISGLKWTLKDGKLLQRPGAVATCSTMSPVCGVNATAIQDPTIDSPLDFDGIPENFPIQFGALLLNAHDAFTANASNLEAVSVVVSSSQPMIPPASTIFNSAAIFHFTLKAESENDNVE